MGDIPHGRFNFNCDRGYWDYRLINLPSDTKKVCLALNELSNPRITRDGSLTYRSRNIVNYRQSCKPDKPLVVVWGNIKIMDKFNQEAEDLWVAIHGNSSDEDKKTLSLHKADQLKKAIGYREYSGTCGTCKCVEVKEHPAVERELILTCTYANHPSLHFVTESHHTCNMWQLKQ